MRMRIDITKVKPNPFRDFVLYPIDPEQVDRLRVSVHDHGFFASVPLRADPDHPGYYQLGAGHHRLAAAKAEGLTHIEGTLGEYGPAEMVSIMVKENLTQRGYNASAVLDSVAATARLIAKAILLGDDVSKFLDTSTPQALGIAQTTITKEGIGGRILYRAMNGFDKKDRKANKDAEIIKSTEIDAALASLKSSGEMGRIMGEVYAEVEAIRAERQAAEDRRAAEAEAREKAAKEAAERAEREAKEAAERAAKASADRKAQAERDAVEARERADAQRKRREVAEAERCEREAGAAERTKEREAEAERHRKQAADIAAQQELEAKYDIRCMNVFRLTSHEQAFREVVTSTNGMKYIPKDQQLPMAKRIREKIDAIEKKRSMDLGSTTVRQRVQDVLREAMGLQREIDEEERQRDLEDNDRRRVMERWATMKRGILQAESALRNLVEEEKKWNYPAPFPIDMDTVGKLRGIGKHCDALAKKLTGV